MMDLEERAEQIRNKIRLEGRIEGERSALLRVIISRRIVLSPRQFFRIKVCDDSNTLQYWLQRAATATIEAEIFASQAVHSDAK